MLDEPVPQRQKISVAIVIEHSNMSRNFIAKNDRLKITIVIYID